MTPSPRTGWTYYHSAALDMRYATRTTPDGPEVVTEDKTHYSAGEVALLSGYGNGEGITPGIHAAKRVFDGRIVYAGPVRPHPPTHPPHAV